MGTFTAQILVGFPHPHHEGITHTHLIYLSENSRPAWILTEQNVFLEETSDFSKITWIPTIEHMLEDALLMIAIYIIKNDDIVQKAKSFLSSEEPNWVEMYEDISESHRNELYSMCRKIPNLPKIIISAFRGSSILNQLGILKKYSMPVEVCLPTYSRIISDWLDKPQIEGML